MYRSGAQKEFRLQKHFSDFGKEIGLNTFTWAKSSIIRREDSPAVCWKELYLTFGSEHKSPQRLGQGPSLVSYKEALIKYYCIGSNIGHRQLAQCLQSSSLTVT